MKSLGNQYVRAIQSSTGKILTLERKLAKDRLKQLERERMNGELTGMIADRNIIANPDTYLKERGKYDDALQRCLACGTKELATDKEVSEYITGACRNFRKYRTEFLVFKNSLVKCERFDELYDDINRSSHEKPEVLMRKLITAHNKWLLRASTNGNCRPLRWVEGVVAKVVAKYPHLYSRMHEKLYIPCGDIDDVKRACKQYLNDITDVVNKGVDEMDRKYEKLSGVVQEFIEDQLSRCISDHRVAEFELSEAERGMIGEIRAEIKDICDDGSKDDKESICLMLAHLIQKRATFDAEDNHDYRLVHYIRDIFKHLFDCISSDRYLALGIGGVFKQWGKSNDWRQQQKWSFNIGEGLLVTMFGKVERQVRIARDPHNEEVDGEVKSIIVYN